MEELGLEYRFECAIEERRNCRARPNTVNRMTVVLCRSEINRKRGPYHVSSEQSGF